MKRLPIKMEFTYRRKESFKNFNPFAIVFVYTSYESYVVKDGINDVEAYFKMKVIEPAILHQTLWHHGLHRYSIKLLNMDNVKLYSRKSAPEMFESFDRSTKWLLWNLYRFPLPNHGHQIKAFKRFPRKWVKELDAYLGVKELDAYLGVKQQVLVKEKPRFGRIIEPCEV